MNQYIGNNIGNKIMSIETQCELIELNRTLNTLLNSIIFIITSYNPNLEEKSKLTGSIAGIKFRINELMFDNGEQMLWV